MHIVFLKCPHVQIAFLKLTSCENQALVGCISIAAVAVHLNLKLVSHLISNNIVNFQEFMTILNACTKKFGNLLKAPCIYIYIYIYIYMCVCVYTYMYTYAYICVYTYTHSYIWIYISMCVYIYIYIIYTSYIV